LHASLLSLEDVFDYPRERGMMLISHMKGSHVESEMDEENLEATEELLKQKIKPQEFTQEQQNSDEVDEQYVVDQINNAESEVINKAKTVWETRAHRIQNGEVSDGLSKISGAVKQEKKTRGGRVRGKSNVNMVSETNRKGVSLRKKKKGKKAKVTDDAIATDDETGDDAFGDDTAGDDTIGDDTTGDDNSGDDTSGDDTARDDGIITDDQAITDDSLRPSTKGRGKKGNKKMRYL
jgi:hypothetical protein